MMNELRTAQSLLRQMVSINERMLLRAQVNDEVAEAREARLLASERARRVQGKVNLMRPLVRRKFQAYRLVVQAAERDPVVQRAVLDALRDLEADNHGGVASDGGSVTFEEIDVMVTHVANKGSIEMVVRANRVRFLMCHPDDQAAVAECIETARAQDVDIFDLMQSRGGTVNVTNTPRDMR